MRKADEIVVRYAGLLELVAPLSHATPVSPELLKKIVKEKDEERMEVDRDVLRKFGLESLIEFDEHGNPKSAFAMPERTIQFWHRGRFREVFAVSGNAWRGIARRLTARYTLDVLGIDEAKLDLGVVQALFAGGVLAGNLSRRPARRGFVADLRRTVPLLDVFGGCINGFTLPGCLRVGFVVPLTRETLEVFYGAEWQAWLREEAGAPEELPGTDEIQAVRYLYTRCGHAEYETPAVDSGGRKSKDSLQQLYAIRVVPAGLRFGHWVGLVAPAGEGSVLCFEAAVALMLKAGMIGGKGAAGHGLFRGVYRRPDGTALDPDGCLAAYRSWLEANKEKVSDMLLRDICENLQYAVPEEIKRAVRIYKAGKEVFDEVLAGGSGVEVAGKLVDAGIAARVLDGNRDDLVAAALAGLDNLRKAVLKVPEDVRQYLGEADPAQLDIARISGGVEDTAAALKAARQSVAPLESWFANLKKTVRQKKAENQV